MESSINIKTKLKEMTIVLYHRALIGMCMLDTGDRYRICLKKIGDRYRICLKKIVEKLVGS